MDFLQMLLQLKTLQDTIIQFKSGLIQAGFTKAQATKITTHLFTGGEVKQEDLRPSDDSPTA